MPAKTEVPFNADTAHLYFAKALHGEVWELLEKESRTLAEDERMVLAAHASLYHWLHVGTAANHQRGEWLIARVYAALGHAENARRHAEQCQTLTETHRGEMQDFDIAFALEGLARAHRIAGNITEAARYRQEAEAAGHAIADAEDRQIFFTELNTR